MLATLLQEEAGVLVEQIIAGEDVVTVVARLTTPAQPCPACSHPATGVHSRSRRTLQDLPTGGRRVRLVLQVRRFFCRHPSCPRRTFTEQAPMLAAPHAQRTCRVQATLRQIGFALGGKAGARLTRALGMPCSPDTLVRLVRRAPLPPLPTPRVLGVDDWSFRKGRTFGTLLVDLERHQPVDLLPDREGPRLSAWLLAHPGVQIVSRDRSQTYAEAIRLGAPHALQVADRWHLLKNLGEALEGFLLHKKQALKEALPRSCDSPPSSPAPAPWTTGRTKEAEATSLRRYARFIELYQQVHALEAKQLRVTDIAERLAVSRGTVYHYLQMDHPPERPSPQDRRSRPLDRYKPYLLQRWNEGIRNSRQLWRELVARGYQQSSAPVQRFIGPLRQQTGTPHKFKSAAAAPLYTSEEVRQRPLTPPQAARLLCSQEQARRPWQQAYLTRLCANDEAIAQTYHLVQAFGTLVRDRPGVVQVDQWLAEVEQCGVPELQTFVAGLKKDYDAVLAGLTSEWSNGPTEGCVNKLKLIKRLMYGRGSFPLLRQRVLQRGEIADGDL
jgi:transposase